jgi:hypothetical protein
MENKHNGITLVVAMIAAASLLSLGAVAAPAYAGGDDGVKQKAVSEADCDQKNKVVDGTGNFQDNFQELCLAISANLNDIEIGGGIVASSEGQSSEEFSAPSTP